MIKIANKRSIFALTTAMVLLVTACAGPSTSEPTTESTTNPPVETNPTTTKTNSHKDKECVCPWQW